MSPGLGRPPPAALGDADFFREALTGDPSRFHVGAPIAVGSPRSENPVAQRLTAPTPPDDGVGGADRPDDLIGL